MTLLQLGACRNSSMASQVCETCTWTSKFLSYKCGRKARSTALWAPMALSKKNLAGEVVDGLLVPLNQRH